MLVSPPSSDLRRRISVLTVEMRTLFFSASITVSTRRIQSPVRIFIPDHVQAGKGDGAVVGEAQKDVSTCESFCLRAVQVLNVEDPIESCLDGAESPMFIHVKRGNHRIIHSR